MNSNTLFDDVTNMMNDIGNNLANTFSNLFQDIETTLPDEVNAFSNSFNTTFNTNTSESTTSNNSESTTSNNDSEKIRKENKKKFNIYVRGERMSENLKNELGYKLANCTICLDTISNGEVCRITPCNHIFHHDCSEKWFVETNQEHTCPMCRLKCF